MSLPSLPITEQRLWVLYCVADLSYREISEFTGWKWNEVKHGIRKWNLAWTHARHLHTDSAIRAGMADAFHVHKHAKPPAKYASMEAEWPYIEATILMNESRKAFRKRILAGDAEWSLIDVLDVEKSVVVLARCLREEWAREQTA